MRDRQSTEGNAEPAELAGILFVFALRALRALRSKRTVALVVLVVLLVCGGTGARAASLFDPALRFHVLRTPHFRIYFHQGADVLATRLAGIAEDSWRRLERPLGALPPPLTHVVI